jgi:type I restriction enzyme S subunit
LIQHEIGGGWGQAEPTEQEREPAAVIRGTDLPRVAVGETENVPRRFHRSSALSKRLLRENDIVFEVSGGSKDQPVGRSMLVSQRVLDALDNRAICASFCKLIRIDPNLADPRFVFRVLQLAYVDGTLDRFYVQSTGITNFKWKTFLADYLVDLPSVETQSRVAGVLGAFDDLIENNHRRIALIEQMAAGIYREWFVRFRYPSREDDELVDSPVGLIPASWEVTTLAEQSAKLVDGDWIESKDQGGGDFRLLQVSNIAVGRFRETGNYRFITNETFERLRCTEIQPGDILISRMPDPVGRSWLVDHLDWRAVTAVDVAILTPRSPPAGSFLDQWLNSPETLAHAETVATGTTRKRITRSVLGRLALGMPPEDVLTGFHETVSRMMHMKSNLRQVNTKLQALRDLLLPRLVTGAVDVSHLDLDALLEETAA